MICGALQTLNEEAFEDVVASERPSPTGGPSTGETIPLTPIQETAEHERSLGYTNDGTDDRLQLHNLGFSTNISCSNLNNIDTNNSSHNISLSNMNKENNSMVTASQHPNNNNNNTNNKLMGFNNVHEQQTTHSQSNQINPISSGSCTSLMLENESTIDNNHTAISITPTSSTPSTIILMPDAKSTGTDSKPFIDDTRL